MTASTPHEFQQDIDAVARIDAVPTILDVVCRITGMGFAAVARVTEDRWIACQVLDKIEFGLEPGGELKVATTICNEIRQSGEPVVIDHVATDEAYCGHPTPAMYGFQSYISMPIIHRNGQFFGTLCAIDPRPARLKNPETIGMFRLFAELIASHLDNAEQLTTVQGALAKERGLAELREQFIAVLGHDLRNPLAAIESGTRLLGRTLADEDSRQLLTWMQGSVLRMKGLIDNVMDFARARLGGGIALQLDAAKPFQPIVEHVVAEMRLAFPNRMIDASFAITEPVTADHLRLARLFSNLLGNAVTHGAPDAPVRAGGTTDKGWLELWVSNAGTVIPAETLEGLFQPFVRGKAEPGKEGLGLGLYIASQIAHAHGGTLQARSGPEETRFTFRMPL